MSALTHVDIGGVHAKRGQEGSKAAGLLPDFGGIAVHDGYAFNGEGTMARRTTLSLSPALAALLAFAAALNACGSPTPTTPAAQPTTAPSTVAVLATLTAVPTSLPVPTQEQPAATPLIPGMPSCPMPVNALKYLLFEKFGKNIIYCDPDYWPLVRDEGAPAQQWYAEADKNAEEFQTILKENKLDRASNLTPEQILALYRDYKRLQQVVIVPEGDKCTFQIAVAKGAVEPSGAAGPGKKYDGYLTTDGSIQVTKEEPYGPLSCPICLAGNTLIDAPTGAVFVRDMREGMLVWTSDGSGARQRARVLKTNRTKVPAGHQMMHLVLADGRSLLVSPGHPTADGRPIGTLSTGDFISGTRVVRAERVPYEEDFTYDILPSGGTGTYWANGILIGSTLGGLGTRH